MYIWAVFLAGLGTQLHNSVGLAVGSSPLMCHILVSLTGCSLPSCLFGFVCLTQKNIQVWFSSSRQVCASCSFLHFLLPAPTYQVVLNKQSENETGNTSWLKAYFASLSLQQTAAMARWPSQPWPSRPTRTAAASPWRCPTHGGSSSRPSAWQTCCSTLPRWRGDRATDSRRSMRWEEPFFTWLSREVALMRDRRLRGESNWFWELLFLNSPS